VEGSSSKRLRIEDFIVENLEEEVQSETGTVGEIQKEPIYSMDLLPSMFLNPTEKGLQK
jgi:hypothetical protein